MKSAQQLQNFVPLSSHELLFRKLLTDTLVSSNLPMITEPHPHDYDWRFNLPTVMYLDQISATLARSSQDILLLGTPSLIHPLVRTHANMHPILIDRNPALIHRLKKCYTPRQATLVQMDLLSSRLRALESPVSVVVCDPPWYLEHYNAFITQAASVANMGATILVSLLPEHTRPSASADRMKILEIADACGLRVDAIESGALRYSMPEFERVSLQTSGTRLDKEWRTGDLLILTKVATRTVEDLDSIWRSSAVDPFDRGEWEEILFGPYKVKLRGPFEIHNEPPALLSIEVNDLLPTVSRRYPGRKHIDLWLWDNRVYAVRGRGALRAALCALSGVPPHHSNIGIPDENYHMALDLLMPLLTDLPTLQDSPQGIEAYCSNL